ncbi:MAG TPA: carboxypeptidase-like regulatory domain-containing protein, partial [Pyrinomonadaceae bacterium]|nr:carboxypeptidase-like regulatory domain-containing protein [Pyrinomonadaceae bacterium]
MLKSNPITRSLAVLGAFVFAMFMAINVFAQAGSTSINGTITDQNGAVVPGATVKVTNPATGFSRTVTTNADGAYVFASILPGSYNIEVEAAKFKKAVKRDVKASVDSTLAVNISLEPGEVSAVIDVTGGDIESVVNTQDAT